MIGEAGRFRVRVRTARVRHHVGRDAGERFLPAERRAFVDREPVAGHADEAHALRLQPADEPLEPTKPVDVLGRQQLFGARSRAPNDVRHADAVDAQRVERVEGAGDEPGRERRGPEPVARTGEAHPHVGRHQTGIEPHHQDTHIRTDRVGEQPAAGGFDVDPLLAVVDQLVDDEAGPFDDVVEMVRVP